MLLIWHRGEITLDNVLTWCPRRDSLSWRGESFPLLKPKGQGDASDTPYTSDRGSMPTVQCSFLSQSAFSPYSSSSLQNGPKTNDMYASKIAANTYTNTDLPYVHLWTGSILGYFWVLSLKLGGRLFTHIPRKLVVSMPDSERFQHEKHNINLWTPQLQTKGLIGSSLAV